MLIVESQSQSTDLSWQILQKISKCMMVAESDKNFFLVSV